MAPALTKVTQNGHGIHLSSSPGGHGIHLSSSPGGHGIHLSSSPGGHGIHHLSSSPGGHGIHLSSSPGGHGIHLSSSPGGHGIHHLSSSPGGHGIHHLLSSPGGHGIHHLPSSPGLAPAKADAEGADLEFDVELDRQRPVADDGRSQNVWLSPSFLPFLGSCLPGGLLEFADDGDLPRFQLQASSFSDQRKPAAPPPGPRSLLDIVTHAHKSQRDAQPGALGSFLLSVRDEADRQEGGVPPHRHGGAVHRHEPDVRFETHISGRPPWPAPPPLPSGKGVTLGRPSSGPEWTLEHCSTAPGPPAVPDRTAGIQQTHLAVRGQRCSEGPAHRLQGRPPAPLAAEHAMLQHCSQQLPGLEDRETADAPSPETGLCNKAGLTLDWDATASSSSSDGDDDPEVDRSQQQRSSSSKRRRDNQASPTSSEVRWLGERAEMGSRWSWLLLRLAEVETRVRHLVDLHKRLHSTKIGVVLGDTQPLTDQQARARGGDLPWDADYEPSSPARLLRNIERQSAQLSQIVTSLSPFSSPLSKPTPTWVGVAKKDCYSDQGAHGKRRRPGIRGRHRLLQASLKGCCARARPLLTYHKHRLFTMEEPGTGALQDNRSTSPPYSSSCEPGVLCSQTTCHSTTGPGGSLTCGTSHSNLHPVLYCSREQMDSPFCSHLQRAPSGERWSQRPMVVNVAEPCDPTLRRDGPRHSGHRRRHRATPRGGVSPRWTDFCRTPHKRANRRRSKRRRALTFIEDEESLSYLLCGRQEISELLEEACTQYPKHTCRLASQRPVHRQQGETVYGINNIIFPMSLAPSAQVERRPYKHVLTPSWRLVNMQSSQDMGGEEEEVEVVTDETFLQRHLEPEQREALRRSSWSKRRGCRRSPWPASEEGPCSSGEEESTMEVSSALLETDEHPGTEEKLMPASPWEPRLFPLAEAPEEAPPVADIKESTSLSRAGPLSQAGPLSILSSSGASLGPSAGQNRNSMLPLCSC